MIINSVQEFYSFFEKNRPLLGIDYGNKKIGIAISSHDHAIAMPHSIVLAKSEPDKLNKILDIVIKNNICAIVIGLPVYMDGTHSEQTKTTMSFAQKLSEKTKLPVFMQDERLTSRAADNLLKDMGFNRKQRNQRDDLASASLILETTLLSAGKL